MSSTYFIVGASGQLGTALAARYPDATVVDRDEFDITSPASYRSVDWSLYDTFINAAAMTNVDGAETIEGRASTWAVNAVAVGLIAQTATEHQLTLVHVSSDYVFDGGEKEHTEDEPFTPLSVYGQTKAAGDIAASTAPMHYILRTSWVIGEGKNFISIMHDLAGRGIKPSVVNDQIGRLTFVPTLVRTIEHLLSTRPAYGTYNCSNSGDSVSWADVAKLVYERAGKSASDIAPVTTEAYYEGKDGMAPRPLNSTLNLEKLESTGHIPTDWRAEFDIYWNNTEKKS
jgi:dTDP-4-dehydrorhamnose 3,5-epimerase/reductase